jgi:hypothetical protein
MIIPNQAGESGGLDVDAARETEAVGRERRWRSSTIDDKWHGWGHPGAATFRARIEDESFGLACEKDGGASAGANCAMPSRINAERNGVGHAFQSVCLTYRVLPRAPEGGRNGEPGRSR